MIDSRCELRGYGAIAGVEPSASGLMNTQMPSPIFTVALPSRAISVNDCRAELYLNALRASTDAKYLSAVIRVPSDRRRECPMRPGSCLGSCL